MSRVSVLVVMSIGLFCSAASSADDESVVRAASTPTKFLAVPGEWTNSDIWIPEINTLEFQDNSPLARISRVRDLPLLTLSETSQSRLFLGVNSDGVFGLHFRAR